MHIIMLRSDTKALLLRVGFPPERVPREVWAWLGRVDQEAKCDIDLETPMLGLKVAVILNTLAAYGYVAIPDRASLPIPLASASHTPVHGHNAPEKGGTGRVSPPMEGLAVYGRFLQVSIGQDTEVDASSRA